MKTIKEKIRTIKISRKTVMFLMISLSLLVSTGTFAYWASYVEGAFNSHTMSITVGSINYVDYEFVLYDEYDEGVFYIDADTLVDYKTPTRDSIDINFGILWEDQTIDNPDGSTTVARIEVDYEIYGEMYGRELSNNRYKKVNKVLDITFDNDNPEYVELNGTTASFNMNIGTKSTATNNQYKVFSRSDIWIIVTYRVIYETTY